MEHFRIYFRRSFEVSYPELMERVTCRWKTKLTVLELVTFYLFLFVHLAEESCVLEKRPMHSFSPRHYNRPANLISCIFIWLTLWQIGILLSWACLSSVFSLHSGQESCSRYWKRKVFRHFKSWEMYAGVPSTDLKGDISNLCFLTCI